MMDTRSTIAILLYDDSEKVEEYFLDLLRSTRVDYRNDSANIPEYRRAEDGRIMMSLCPF